NAIDRLDANGADRERKTVGAGDLIGSLLRIVERNLVLGVEAVVDLNAWQVLIAVVGVVRNPVVDQAGARYVRLRNKFLNGQRDRVQIALGNDVARERLAVNQSIDGLVGAQVVNRAVYDRVSLRIVPAAEAIAERQSLAEIAIPVSIDG